jgi:hypothetical protein
MVHLFYACEFSLIRHPRRKWSLCCQVITGSMPAPVTVAVLEQGAIGELPVARHDDDTTTG